MQGECTFFGMPMNRQTHFNPAHYFLLLVALQRQKYIFFCLMNGHVTGILGQCVHYFHSRNSYKIWKYTFSSVYFIRIPFYILSNILYRLLEPYIITLILLKMMYRISFLTFLTAFSKELKTCIAVPKKGKATQYLYGRQMFCFKKSEY